jgi:hypothetical protein
MQPTIAYLSQGRLFVREPDKPPREIESAFAKETEERQSRSRSIDGWKGRSAVWGQMGMAPPEFSQWEQAGAEGLRRIKFRSLCRGPKPTDLMYVLDLETVSGVFRYDLAQGYERRLMHRNDFVARDLVCHPEAGTLAVSLAHPDGSASLAFSDDEGRHWNHVTGGDSVDEAPHWIPGDGRKIVFQSAGVGRNGHGVRLALGPYAIETLDLDGKGDTETILADDKSDLLLPRKTADGTLYFLRRPYKPFREPHLSLGQFLWDVLMLPFRLLLTILHIFNFFSVMFSGQPLATAFGAANRRAAGEQQFLMLWGHMIDTRQAMAKAGNDAAVPLVPKEWQLVRRDAGGSEQVIASSVLAYDVLADGRIVLSDGTAIYLIDTAGKREKLCEGKFIEVVTAVAPAESRQS